MTDDNKIKKSIRESLLRAKKIFEDRDEAVRRINSLFSNIQEEMNNDVVFETNIISEGAQYITFGIYAKNGKYTDNPRKVMIRYSFGKPNAFPMEIDLPSYGVYACSDLTEVSDTLENIISIDDFALSIISIAQEEKSEPNIPF